MAAILINNIPPDIKKYILKIQGEIKVKKGTQFSQECTIVQIIREHKEIFETKKSKKDEK